MQVSTSQPTEIIHMTTTSTKPLYTLVQHLRGGEIVFGNLKPSSTDSAVSFPPSVVRRSPRRVHANA